MEEHWLDMIECHTLPNEWKHQCINTNMLQKFIFEGIKTPVFLRDLQEIQGNEYYERLHRF